MSTDFERFPILYRFSEEREAAQHGWPISVPLRLLAPHEAQAARNHSQTLRRLAQRGGLHPVEILAVISDKDYRHFEHMTTAAAIQEIMRRGGLAGKGAP
jgi:hypothetical protein